MKRLVTSCFGLGWLPAAPGTWGSLPPMFIFVLLCLVSNTASNAHLARFPRLACYIPLSAIMAGLALISSIICIKFAPDVIAITGQIDPREVVIDEFAGQAVTFIPILTVSPSHVWTTAVLGLVLFRGFDIAKLWPTRKLEKLPRGWGILLDDLLAGIYAGMTLLLCLQIGLVSHIAETFSFSSSLPLSQLAIIGSTSPLIEQGQASLTSVKNGAYPPSLNIFLAAILGAVQGLTEFLPVSSSGHLVLFEKIFGFSPEKQEMLLFDLATHLGTLIAIFIVFRKSIAAFCRNLTESGKYGNTVSQIYKRSPSVHILVLAVAATMVTGVLGLLFEKYFTSARQDLVIVALMWVITATLLLITDYRKKTYLGLRKFALWQAMVIGVSQAAALMPGISRSGATICTAILIGLHRRWAIEFSFLLAIPAILGATAIQTQKQRSDGK